MADSVPIFAPLKSFGQRLSECSACATTALQKIVLFLPGVISLKIDDAGPFVQFSNQEVVTGPKSHCDASV